MWNSVLSVGPGEVIQILVLAFAFYYIFVFFKGTRGAQVLVGLSLVIALSLGLTEIFHLDALNWLLRRISVFLGIAVLIIFQPEFRRALAELGRQPWLVYGILRTEGGYSPTVSAGNTIFSLLGFMGLYLLLGILFLFLASREVGHGPGGHGNPGPAQVPSPDPDILIPSDEGR